MTSTNCPIISVMNIPPYIRKKASNYLLAFNDDLTILTTADGKTTHDPK